MHCAQCSIFCSFILTKLFYSFLNIQLLQKYFTILSWFFCSLILQSFFNLFEISLTFSLFSLSLSLAAALSLRCFGGSSVSIARLEISMSAQPYLFDVSNQSWELMHEFLCGPGGLSSILSQFFCWNRDFDLDSDTESTSFFLMRRYDGFDAFWALTKRCAQKVVGVDYWKISTRQTHIFYGRSWHVDFRFFHTQRLCQSKNNCSVWSLTHFF